jgi:hypothetical protein
MPSKPKSLLKQNEKHDQQKDTSARVVAPLAAVWPLWSYTQQHKYKQDEQESSEHELILLSREHHCRQQVLLAGVEGCERHLTEQS